MARTPQRPAHLPPFGALVWDAMERRARERGEPYGYLHLARDINERRRAHAPPGTTPPEAPATTVRRIITGQRPTARLDQLREIIATLGLDERTALLAAGRAPEDVQRAARDGRLPEMFTEPEPEPDPHDAPSEPA